MSSLSLAARRLLLLLAVVALAACDTQPPMEEPEPEPELGPIAIGYVIEAPDILTDYSIRYTDAEGQTVFVPTQDRLTFPYRVDIELPADGAGTFFASIDGFASSGTVRVSIQAFQDGLLLDTATDSDEATGPDDAVTATAEIEIGGS